MTRIENVFLDRMFLSRYRPTPVLKNDSPVLTDQKLNNLTEQVILILIDKNTIDNLHNLELFQKPQFKTWNTQQWPFDRRITAMAIKRISEMNAAVIGVDLLFLHSKNAIEDKALVDSVRESKRVILASMVDYDREGNFLGHKKPFEALSEAAAGVGFVNVDTETDGVLRHIPLTLGGISNNQIHYSFALVCWQKNPINLNFAITEHSISGNKLIIPDSRDNSLSKIINLYENESKQSRILVNWKGPSASFPTISFLDLFDDSKTPHLHKRIQGKTVLIGLNHPGLQDSFATPLYAYNNLETPGVEVHANVLNTLSNHKYRTFKKAPMSLQFTIYLILALALTFSTVWLRIGISLPLFLMELLIGWLIANLIFFDYLSTLFPVIVPSLSLTICYTAMITLRVVNRELEKSNIRKVFNQYVSNKVVDELLLNPESLSMGGKSLEISTLFSDIRGFTTLSENKTPAKVVEILNTYFELMVAVITKHNGTINKFIGDAVMVLYGAPVRQNISPKEQAILCVKTAIEMQETLKASSDKKLKELLVGIGISTGYSVVGNIGAQKHKDYTAIGDKINLAARLQTKAEAFEIIVDYQTREYCSDHFAFEELTPFTVKGKQELIRAYKVIF